MAKDNAYESQTASCEVHEGGRYVVKNGKPVKELVSDPVKEKESK